MIPGAAWARAPLLPEPGGLDEVKSGSRPWAGTWPDQLPKTIELVAGRNPRGDAARLAETGHEVRVLPYPVYWGDGGWYADVAMPGAAASSYCPFAQLAITRFQRHSLENLSLSSVVLTDMVPLLPDRELTMHTEGNRVTVALSGLSREGDRPNRVIALVEGCDTDDAPGAPVELTSLTGASPGFPVWVRVAGASVTRYTNQELPPLTLPSGPRRLRVVVREYEDLGEVGDGLVDAPSELTERTVYLDIVHLPTN